MGTFHKIFGTVYLLLALYLVNAAFDLIPMPGFILGLEMWIFLISAVLLVIPGIKHMLKKKATGLPGMIPGM